MYVVSIPTGNRLQVDLTELTGNIALAVFDNSSFIGSPVCSSSEAGLQDESCKIAPQAGSLLYIRVTGLNSSGGARFNIVVGPILYYIETFANGSGNSADTRIVLYDASENVLASEYDISQDNTYTQMTYRLESGSTYYILVDDYSNQGDYYTFHISDVGFWGVPYSGTVSSDPYEPDYRSSAVSVDRYTPIDRSLDPTGDSDWFVFTAP